MEKYSTLGTVLGWVALFLGATLLITSFFLPASNSRIMALFLGLGIAFFPAGIFTILSDLNYSRRTSHQIGKALESSTYTLTNSIDGLKYAIDFLKKSRSLGITMGFKNREEALTKFMQHLENYVSNPAIPDKKFIFVGSSIKGLIGPKDFGDRLRRLIRENEPGDAGTKFSFLLTHPAYSRYREIQENRAEGDIAKEILHAISWLAHQGIRSENVKVYKGTPTCFLMASTEKMLINPYPYELEAYKCFSLEVENNGESDSIYRSYFENHFNKPWTGDRHDRDHYHQPSALPYFWDYFDGPSCDDEKGKRVHDHPICDVLFIDDKSSFYIAVNISTLEREIAYKDVQGETKVISVSDEISIQLLLRESDNWEEIGKIELGADRRKFWNRTITEHAINAYKYIGLFDPINSNPLCLQISKEGDQGLLFWKKVPLND